jgi:hypothetical protein
MPRNVLVVASGSGNTEALLQHAAQLVAKPGVWAALCHCCALGVPSFWKLR